MIGEMYTDILNAAQYEARLDERRGIANRLRHKADAARRAGQERDAAIWDSAADEALDHGDGHGYSDG